MRDCRMSRDHDIAHASRVVFPTDERMWATWFRTIPRGGAAFVLIDKDANASRGLAHDLKVTARPRMPAILGAIPDVVNTCNR